MKFVKRLVAFGSVVASALACSMFAASAHASTLEVSPSSGGLTPGATRTVNVTSVAPVAGVCPAAPAGTETISLVNSFPTGAGGATAPIACVNFSPKTLNVQGGDTIQWNVAAGTFGFGEGPGVGQVQVRFTAGPLNNRTSNIALTDAGGAAVATFSVPNAPGSSKYQLIYLPTNRTVDPTVDVVPAAPLGALVMLTALVSVSGWYLMRRRGLTVGAAA